MTQPSSPTIPPPPSPSPPLPLSRAPQEIYGLAPQKDADYEDAEGQDCVICMSERRDTMVLPCRHLCLCKDCSKALRTQTHKCPICRIDIVSFLTLDKAGGGEGRAATAAPAGA